MTGNTCPGTGVATRLSVPDQDLTVRVSPHQDDQLQTGCRVTARGDIWTVESRARYSDCEAIRLRAASSADSRSLRTLLRPFDHITPIPPVRTARVVGSHAWGRGVVAAVTATRAFGSLGSAADGRIDILPFQLEPALAMLRHGHTRVLIADEVGLGKTVQAGLVLSELSAENGAFRGLVLAPAALVEQWIHELRERFGLEMNRADAGWLSAQSRRLPADVNPWSLPGTYIASIDLVKRPEVLRPLEDVTWDLIVIDEAHGAGLGTARHSAANAIATRSRRVVLLTATPPDGDPPQLAALMGVGSLDDPVVQFRRSRDDIGRPPRRRTVLLQIRLSTAERRMHRLLSAYTSMVWNEAASTRESRAPLVATLLRKRALSSASSLAVSARRRMALLAGELQQSEQQLLLPLGEEDAIDDEVVESVLACPGLSDRARERSILERIARFAEAAADDESKLRVSLRLLRRARQPAIVFTEYRDTLTHIDSAVRAAGHATVRLHGGMSARERSESVRAFDDSETLLLATDAASEGLNLHRRCRLVIHFELPWTLSRLEQRTGRVDRLGQTRTVHEVLLVARSTAERLVLVPLLKRARTAAGSGGRHGSRLLAITESMVAAGVINGEPINLSREEPPRMTVQDFSAEADLEAQRITFQRRVGARASTAKYGERVLITVARSGGDTRILLLVRVALCDDTGRLAHSELVPLEAHATWTAERRRHLRNSVGSFVDDRWAAIVEIAERHTKAAIDVARQQQIAVIGALQRRDRAMLGCLPSTARHLVQAGLFDRRVLKALETTRRTAALLIDDTQARADAHAAALRTGLEMRLVAVRLGSRR